MSMPPYQQPYTDPGVSPKRRGCGLGLAIVGAVGIILVALCLAAGGIFYFSGGMQSEALSFLHSPTPTVPTSTPRPTHTPRPTSTSTPLATPTAIEPDYPGNTHASDYFVILRSANTDVQDQFQAVSQRLISLGYRVEMDTNYGVIGQVNAVQYGNLDCLETIDILRQQLDDLILVPNYTERFGSTDLSYEARNIVIQIVDEDLIVTH